MKKILIATRNKGKLNEFRNFLSGLSLEIVSLVDLNIKDDFEEKGRTYFENSTGKAEFYSKISNLPTIADDGGIEISALGGEPGVKTRRWLGHEASDQELVTHMINISKNLPENNRTAYFRAVVSFASPNGKIFSAKGEVKGIIAKKPYLKPLQGYPFRSFFYLPKINKYYHEDELAKEEERLYNHRYKAIQKLIPIIRRELIS